MADPIPLPATLQAKSKLGNPQAQAHGQTEAARPRGARRHCAPPWLAA
jgi:hypothetical protein